MKFIHATKPDQTGNEIDREIEKDVLVYINGTAFSAKVMDTYFVKMDEGDVQYNDENYVQAVSRESLFGDADDPEHSESFFSELDAATISSIDKSSTLVEDVAVGNSHIDYFLNARPRHDNDFKRSILAGAKTSNANVNTSYVLTDQNGKMWIANRNEAGNYLFGIGAKQKGISLPLLRVSGHGVEWIRGRIRLDEPNEQQMLSAGWKAEKYRK